MNDISNSGIQIKFRKKPSKTSNIHVVVTNDKNALGGRGKDIDKKTGKLLSYTIKSSTHFKGKSGQALSITMPEGSGLLHAVLFSVGADKKLSAQEAENAGGKLYAFLSAMSVESASLFVESYLSPENTTHLALGFKLASYRFDKYKKKNDIDGPKRFKNLEIILDDNSKVGKAYERLDHAATGTFLARDLVNEPPNKLYPETMANRIREELEPLGVDVSIFNEKQLLKMGMGSLMAVGQGSDFPPRMVIMRWNGGKATASSKKKTGSVPIALVGKGVTFDTGGISLKPGPGMQEMKMDMGGAAAVIGAMKTLALRGAKADVIGAVGLVENMPSARSYRPADILTSYSGKTIEVLNTDAEGRLVLADVLSYVQDKYSPGTIIDLATLTGAMMVALANEYCGTFSNDDALWRDLEKASADCGEKLWRMPLDEEWKKSMEGTFGDVQNLSKMGRNGGACTAAGFLEHFIDDGVKWAHLDIAGTAWIPSSKPTIPKHATGFGARLLDQYIENVYG